MLSFFPSGYLISKLLKLDVDGMFLGAVVAGEGLEDDTVA